MHIVEAKRGGTLPSYRGIDSTNEFAHYRDGIAIESLDRNYQQGSSHEKYALTLALATLPAELPISSMGGPRSFCRAAMLSRTNSKSRRVDENTVAHKALRELTEVPCSISEYGIGPDGLDVTVDEDPKSDLALRLFEVLSNTRFNLRVWLCLMGLKGLVGD